jgi:hypothetical protein
LVAEAQYSFDMTTKSATASATTEEAKYLAEIDECIAEIAEIRRGIKTTRSEIRRLKNSTDRKLRPSG